MKLLLLLFFIPLSLFAYNDHDVSGAVEAEGFYVGDDKDLGGSFFYIVDRTNKLCFAGTRRPQYGTGTLIKIPCKALKRTPEINTYMETGEIIEKKKVKKRYKTQ
ncbi:MAG: hypothetical protein E2O68_05075 [Deltaproteobacteria bacterium]|nr:MAG: hypothetical protein E2O68_05075 [Deltaproteobacteria bacterium]